MSLGTPIFFAHSVLTGIDAAEEQVASAVTVAGNIFFQYDTTPFLPAAINVNKV